MITYGDLFLYIVILTIRSLHIYMSLKNIFTPYLRRILVTSVQKIFQYLFTDIKGKVRYKWPYCPFQFFSTLHIEDIQHDLIKKNVPTLYSFSVILSDTKKSLSSTDIISHNDDAYIDLSWWLDIYINSIDMLIYHSIIIAFTEAVF